MLRKISLIVALSIIYFTQAQNKKAYFENSKIIKSIESINGKETEVIKYRFFNNKIVVVNFEDKNWEAEADTFHSNGTCEKNEKVWIDANNNIVTSFKQYYTSHDHNSKNYHGNIYNEFSYINGVKSGVEKFYYANGKVKKSGFVNKKGRQGEWKTYYVNGNLKSCLLYTSPSPRDA